MAPCPPCRYSWSQTLALGKKLKLTWATSNFYLKSQAKQNIA